MSRCESNDSELAVIVVYRRDDDVTRLVTGRVAGKVPGLAAAVARGELKGSPYDLALFRGSPAVLLVGAGPAKEFDGVRFLRAVQAGARFASQRRFSKLAVVLEEALEGEESVRAAVEGAIRGLYDEALLKTRDRESPDIAELTLLGSSAVAESRVTRARIIADSAAMARDLVNLPPADLTPAILRSAVNRWQSRPASTAEFLMRRRSPANPWAPSSASLGEAPNRLA